MDDLDDWIGEEIMVYRPNGTHRSPKGYQNFECVLHGLNDQGVIVYFLETSRTSFYPWMKIDHIVRLTEGGKRVK